MIFIDMDDTIYDWVGAICKIFDLPIEKLRNTTDSHWPRRLGRLRNFITDEQIDKAMEQGGEAFWMDIALLPWAEYVIKECSKEGEVALVSVPFDAGSASAKMKLAKRLELPLFMHPRGYRVHLAGRDDGLVDDNVENIRSWAGPALWLPSVGDTGEYPTQQYIEEQLHDFLREMRTRN